VKQERPENFIKAHRTEVTEQEGGDYWNRGIRASGFYAGKKSQQTREVKWTTTERRLGEKQKRDRWTKKITPAKNQNPFLKG